MKNKTTLNIILFISIFALASAYFVEYILGYKPCNLCLIERLPYFVAIIIILIGLIINRLEKGLETSVIRVSNPFLCQQLRTLVIVGFLSRDTMPRPAPGRRRRHQPRAESASSRRPVRLIASWQRQGGANTLPSSRW